MLIMLGPERQNVATKPETEVIVDQLRTEQLRTDHPPHPVPEEMKDTVMIR